VQALQQRFANKAKWQLKGNVAPTMKSLVDRSSTLYFYVAGVFLVSIFLALIPYFAAKGGRDHAIKEINEFRNKKGNSMTLYSARLPEPIRVRQITCSTSHCAFWQGTEALVLDLEGIKRMDTRNPTTEESIREASKK
jgi:hypothetical protein